MLRRAAGWMTLRRIGSGSGLATMVPLLAGLLAGPVWAAEPLGTADAAAPLQRDMWQDPADDVVFRVLDGRRVQVSTDGWQNEVHTPQNAEQRNGSAMDWPTCGPMARSGSDMSLSVVPPGILYRTAQIGRDQHLVGVRPPLARHSEFSLVNGDGRDVPMRLLGGSARPA